jgi:NhaP-type Na+/H+ or K+/H+ antiporter
MTMMEANVSERPLARYGVVVGVCLLAGGIAGGVSAVFDDGGPASAPIIAATVALAMAVGVWACALWWRGLDEAAQEAHKWAWYWGSTFGGSLGAVALFTVAYAGEAALTAEPKDLLIAGAAIIGLSQMVGYGVAWGFWWLKRR